MVQSMSISNLLTPERINELNEFQKKYNLDFSNLELLNQAFIHTSYVNENKIDVSFSYERLEFLGDAVLKLAVSDFYYEYFPDYQEGKMTKLRGEIVSDKNIFSEQKGHILAFRLHNLFNFTHQQGCGDD